MADKRQANGLVADLQAPLIDYRTKIGITVSANRIGGADGKPDDLFGKGTREALEQLVMLAQLHDHVAPKDVTRELNPRNMARVESYLNALKIEDTTKIMTALRGMHADKENGVSLLDQVYGQYAKPLANVATLKIPSAAPPAPPVAANTIRFNNAASNEVKVSLIYNATPDLHEQKAGRSFEEQVLALAFSDAYKKELANTKLNPNDPNSPTYAQLKDQRGKITFSSDPPIISVGGFYTINNGKQPNAEADNASLKLSLQLDAQMAAIEARVKEKPIEFSIPKNIAAKIPGLQDFEQQSRQYASNQKPELAAASGQSTHIGFVQHPYLGNPNAATETRANPAATVVAAAMPAPAHGAPRPR